MLFSVATASFAFNWISFPNTSTDMMAQASVGYGSWLIIPISIFPISAAFEVNMPFLDGLSAGGGLSYLSVELDLDGDTSDVNSGSIGAGVYAKYIFLTKDQMEELIGLPLIVGAAAGIGWQFEVIQGDFTGYSSGYSTSGIQGLAVGLVGWKAKSWYATMYTGLIDQTFSYSAEFAFSLSDTMHVGLFYIPLLGLGATFTMAF